MQVTATPVSTEYSDSRAEFDFVADNAERSSVHEAATNSNPTYEDLLAKAAHCIKNEKDWPVAKTLRQARHLAATADERDACKSQLKNWWKFCDLSGDYTDLLLASSAYYLNHSNTSAGMDFGGTPPTQLLIPFDQSFEGFTAKGAAERLIQSLNIFLESLESQGLPDFYEAYFYRCRSLQTSISKKFNLEFSSDDHSTTPNTAT